MAKLGVIQSSDESDKEINKHYIKKNTHNGSPRKRSERVILGEDEGSSELSELPSSPAERGVYIAKEANRTSREVSRGPETMVDGRVLGFDILEETDDRVVGEDMLMEEAALPMLDAGTSGNQRGRTITRRNERNNMDMYDNGSTTPPGPEHELHSNHSLYNKTSNRLSHAHPRELPASTTSTQSPPPSSRITAFVPTPARLTTPVSHRKHTTASLRISSTPQPRQLAPSKPAPTTSSLILLTATSSPQKPVLTGPLKPDPKRPGKYAPDFSSWSGSKRIVDPPKHQPPHVVASPVPSHEMVVPIRIKAQSPPRAPSRSREEETDAISASKNPLLVRLKRPAPPVIRLVEEPPQEKSSKDNNTIYLIPESMDIDDEPTAPMQLKPHDSSPLTELSDILPSTLKTPPHYPLAELPERHPDSPRNDTASTPGSPSSPRPSLTLTSAAVPKFDMFLDEAVRHHWSPLAKMREKLANACLEDCVNGGTDIVSDLEDEGGPSEGSLGQRVPAGNVTVIHLSASPSCGGISAAEPAAPRPTVEGNLSVALAMRRYADRFKSGIQKLLFGASVVDTVGAMGSAALNGEVDQPGEVVAASDEPHHWPEPVEDEGRVLCSPSPHDPENESAKFIELPSPPLYPTKLAPASPTTPALSRNESNTPFTINTPATEINTVAALTPELSSKPPSTLLSSLRPRSIRASPLLITPQENTISSNPEADDPSKSHQYDFSYDCSDMQIRRDGSQQGNISLITRNPSTTPAPSPPRNNKPNTKAVEEIFYVPKRHFLGVEIRRPKVNPGDFIRRPITIPDDDSSSVGSAEDISESELGPEALGMYLAIKYYQEHVEPGLQGRKRKGSEIESSGADSSSDDEEYRLTIKGEPKKSYKKRKLSDTTAKPIITMSSPSPPKAYAPAMRQLTATTAANIEVPFGVGVDDLDPATLHVLPVKAGIVGVTKICHQCRNSGTNEAGRIQCGNVTVPASQSTISDSTSLDYVSIQSSRHPRCNKTFCERCLRGWYALDDHAIAFLKTGQRRDNGGTWIGTGLGLGIVEGRWICPVCINMCMCTVCSRRRNVLRKKYKPSAAAVISNAGVERRAKGRRIRVDMVQTTDDSALSSPEKRVRFLGNQEGAPMQSGSRRINPPLVPTQWLPAIPTPTPGLDPVYYEATRPCTRDFPTGAPPPTAANHAPILYQAGATLENDGLEDSFTGSEMDEDEDVRTMEVDGDEARSKASNSAQAQGGSESMVEVSPIKRRNYVIVTPGRRLPTTTKKMNRVPIPQSLSPSSSTPVFHPTTPPSRDQPDSVPEVPEDVNLPTLPVMEDAPNLSSFTEASYFDQQYLAIQSLQANDVDIYSGNATFFGPGEQTTNDDHPLLHNGTINYISEPPVLAVTAGDDVLMNPSDFLSSSDGFHSIDTTPSSHPVSLHIADDSLNTLSLLLYAPSPSEPFPQPTDVEECNQLPTEDDMDLISQSFNLGISHD